MKVQPRKVYISGRPMIYDPVNGHGFIGDSWKKIKRLISKGGRKFINWITPSIDTFKKITESEPVTKMIQAPETTINDATKYIEDKVGEKSNEIKEKVNEKAGLLETAGKKIIEEVTKSIVPKMGESVSDMLSEMLKKSSNVHTSGYGITKPNRKTKSKKDTNSSGEGLFLPGSFGGRGLVTIK